jgi:hypothetical protein
VIALDPLRAGI